MKDSINLIRLKQMLLVVNMLAASVLFFPVAFLIKVPLEVLYGITGLSVIKAVAKPVVAFLLFLHNISNETRDNYVKLLHKKLDLMKATAVVLTNKLERTKREESKLYELHLLITSLETLLREDKEKRA